MSELTIREMESGEEFVDWFADLTEQEEAATGAPIHLEEHYLILSNGLGDWIGGLRYHLRGGVGHLTDIAVRAEERHQGHGHRLLEAFEQHAGQLGAHLVEFWTDDVEREPELLANGWQRVLRRPGYQGGRTWYLMEKRLAPLL